jgi:serine/threonine-protein kinase
LDITTKPIVMTVRSRIIPFVLSLASIALLIAIVVSACSKSSSQPSQPHGTVLSVTAIEPVSGPVQITDTITGTGFSAQSAGDSVYFNGAVAAIVQATTTQLIVTVPAEATTGKVIVKVGDSSATGPVYTVLAVASDSVIVSTLAGSGVEGYKDGADTMASFGYVYGLAADLSGNVFVADGMNMVLRKITPAGAVSTIPGGTRNSPAFGTGPYIFVPMGVAVDQYDTLFVANLVNGYILTEFNDVYAVLAGDRAESPQNNFAVDTFASPRGPAVDKNGNVYIADYNHAAIKKINPEGLVSLMAGGTLMYSIGVDGTGASATFNEPTGVAVDDQGNVFVADYLDERIRKITPAGVVTTFAGNNNGLVASIDGVGTGAYFSGPMGIAIDANNNLYVTDYPTNKIRKITAAGVVTTIAGTGAAGSADGAGHTATFNGPTGITVDGGGNIYVSDAGNYKIRKIVIK